MNLRIDSFSASFNYHSDSFRTIVERLESEGYRPLIRKLAQELCGVVGGNLDDLNGPESTEDVELEINSDTNRRKLLGLEKLGYKWGLDGIRGLSRVPELKGELFLADDSENVLLLTILDASQAKQSKQEGHKNGMMRVGIVGANPDAVLLDLFKTDIETVLQERGDAIEWHQDSIENPQFKEFLSAEEHAIAVLAAGITEREMKSAKALESTGVRDVATTIRKSGVILAKELLRSKPDTAADTVKYVDQLIQADLLHQEYVVICSKSGAHVNRVEHRETIDQMAKLGVSCSCGKKISDEAIEGLLSTDELLPKMLDKNYWMTVSVVRSLISLGVPAEKILLNPSIVNDDVEILADLDGTLLMFNLKDAEYGIPHALSFTTRIGMHRPHMAFLVSTRGVSSDVKDHFKRVKLDTQMVYVPNLLQLEATLKKVVEGVRMLRVKTWFDTFQSMMNFGLTPLLLQRLDMGKVEPKVNPTASLMDSIRAKANTRQTIIEQPVVEESVQQAQPMAAAPAPAPQPAGLDAWHQLVSPEQEVIPPPKISAVEAPIEALAQVSPPISEVIPDSHPVYTAPEPITETLETSYSHHDVASDLDDVEFDALDLPIPAAPAAEPPQASLSPAAAFAQSQFGEEASDSDVAVSELEELISEARESKISTEIEHVIPASAIEFFSDDSNGSNGASEIQNPPQPPQINPYKRVMEMLNPQPQVVTSVIIDDTAAEKAPSAMDILDNVLEAVASNEGQQAHQQPAITNAAVPGNIFSNQYMNYGAQQVSGQPAAESTDEEEEQPVATY